MCLWEMVACPRTMTVICDGCRISVAHLAYLCNRLCHSWGWRSRNNSSSDVFQIGFAHLCPPILAQICSPDFWSYESWPLRLLATFVADQSPGLPWASPRTVEAKLLAPGTRSVGQSGWMLWSEVSGVSGFRPKVMLKLRSAQMESIWKA